MSKNFINGGGPEDLRDMFDNIANDIICSGSRDGSSLSSILSKLPRSQKRHLIIGGALREIRHFEFNERMEQRQRMFEMRHPNTDN
jgi:hypothetical protein